MSVENASKDKKCDVTLSIVRATDGRCKVVIEHDYAQMHIANALSLCQQNERKHAETGTWSHERAPSMAAQDAERCLTAAVELEPGLRSDARLMAVLQRSSTAVREAEELGDGLVQQLRMFAQQRR